MNKISKILILLIVYLFYSCGSTVKLNQSWSDDTLTANLKSKKNLIVAKLDTKAHRYALENEFKEKLEEKGILSETAIAKFPPLQPNKKRTKEELKDLIKIFKNENVNLVILTTLIERDASQNVKKDDVYGTSNTNYPNQYNDFSEYNYSYYGLSIANVPLDNNKTYHLETLIYDLDAEVNNQLLSMSSVTIENPKNLDKIVTKYVDKVLSKVLK